MRRLARPSQAALCAALASVLAVPACGGTNRTSNLQVGARDSRGKALEMTEAELKRKLAAIEALLHGATTEGERAAAEHVFEKLKNRAPTEESADVQFTVQDVWARKLFMAMLKKAGLEAFRRRGQRSTTVMVHGRRSFVVDVVWKQFLEAQRTLAEYLSEVTDRVIRETLGDAESEAKERPALPQG